MLSLTWIWSASRAATAVLAARGARAAALMRSAHSGRQCQAVPAGRPATKGAAMKTSLGIWAFGPMITRFVPVGYQREHSYDTEPVAEKVQRAVEGLGDLIDGYEFHYPDELSPETLDDVRAALGSHDIYCIASGLHLNPRFGRGGLINPDRAIRSEARRILSEAADFAGSLGANLIVWPGGEGYNYP